MFDQLLQLVEQHSGAAIINNAAIPDQHNSAAIRTVTEQIVNTLQSNVSSGNLQQIVSLFQNSGSSSLAHHPIVAQIISSVASQFSSQYGVSSANAQTMAASLLPTVMSQFISKTNNPNDNSFNITSVIQSLGGGSTMDMGSLISQFTGNSSTGSLLGNLASRFFGK